MTKPVLAITMGDAAGIGAEITVKALMKPEIYTQAVPVVIGDRAAIADAIQFCKAPLELHVIQQPEEAEGRYGVIDLIDLGYLTPGGWAYKTVSALTGDASYQYVAKGIALAMKSARMPLLQAQSTKRQSILRGITMQVIPKFLQS